MNDCAYDLRRLISLLIRLQYSQITVYLAQRMVGVAICTFSLVEIPGHPPPHKKQKRSTTMSNNRSRSRSPRERNDYARPEATGEGGGGKLFVRGINFDVSLGS